MLYIYSWKYNWAGKTGEEATAKREEKALRANIQALEEMDAPEDDILNARIKLSNRLLQSEKYMEARDVLCDGEVRLIKQAAVNDASQSLLLKRVELQRLTAIAHRQALNYPAAAEKYEQAAKVLSTADQDDDNVKFTKLALLNDQAVLEYIWANASKEASARKAHFVAAEGKFQKCLAECRFRLSETAGGEQDYLRYKRLAKLSANNWAELLKDLDRGDEIEAIHNMADEVIKIKRGA